MKVNFYLPQVFRGIAGGYKTVYQYSNYLVEKGYDVCIYYDLRNGENSKHIPKFLAIILRKLILLNYPSFFPLSKKVKQIGVKSINNKNIRNADISICTAPSTAFQLSNLKNSKGKKFYFIQGFENWDGTQNKVLFDSYSLNIDKIIISNWLKKIVDKYSTNKTYLLNNGIDLSKFKINIPITKRNDFSVSMLYHNDDIKGCRYGLEALEKIKIKYPNIIVNLFGGCKSPKDLPRWINYHYKANEEEVVSILNNSAIFLCTSLSEGFGLTGLESMACGCTLITTNCLGPLEYANKENSIIIESKNSEQLYRAIEELFNDKNKRIKLAIAGNISAKKWDLKNKEKEFEKIIDEKKTNR